jgi:hypothetical protein
MYLYLINLIFTDFLIPVNKGKCYSLLNNENCYSLTDRIMFFKKLTRFFIFENFIKICKITAVISKF